MQRFDAIWADDEWGSDPVLERAFERVQQALQTRHLHVAWGKPRTREETFLALSTGKLDIRLAILDGRFSQHQEAAEWDVFQKPLRERGISYLIFSQHRAEYRRFVESNPDHRFLSVFEKTEPGIDELVAAVVDFFRSPPFRLLHLTDMHFSSASTGANRTGFEDMLSSLEHQVVSLHSQTPLDLLAITGDFAGHDPNEDLPVASNFVRRLVGSTIGFRNLDRLCIVPGNHDIVWDDFADRRLNESPWSAYIDFMQKVFLEREDLLDAMSAWRIPARLRAQLADSEDLYWARSIPNLPVDIIGLCSISRNAELQGVGHVGREQVRKIVERWSHAKPAGTIRLGLIHHNAFSVISRSPHDEKRIVTDASDVLLSLMDGQCDLLLSGHTHTTTLARFEGNLYRSGGFGQPGSILGLSAGATGGLHPSGQRPRMFSVVEFGAQLLGGKQRQVTIRAFQYDDTRCRWSEVATPHSVQLA